MSYEREPGAGSRRGLIGAGIVLALLLAMGVFVAAMSFMDDEPEEPTPTSDPTSEPTPSGEPSDDPASDASVCGLAGDERSGVLTAGPAVTWSLVGKAAVPTSKTFGPGVIEDSGVRYCYARTPEGAVLMAANTLAWDEALSADPIEVIERSVAEGPGRDAMLSEAQSTAGTAGGDSGFFMQTRGFQLASYDGSTALVDVAYQAGNGNYLHLSYELVWEAGDWRIRLRPDGSLGPAAELQDLKGYIPWAGA